MKRFLLLLMVAVLFLQIPWTGALAHCPQGGNDDTHAATPGHDFDAPHVHDGGEADDGHAAGTAPDCSAVNLVALEPPAVRAQALPRAAATAHDVASPAHESHIPDGLDRPNWRLAA